MDECCACDSGGYRRRMNQMAVMSRHFAVLGLLRKVTCRVPDDLVYTYILRTTDHGEYFDLLYSRDKNLDAPEGLKKMAKDYLVRTFWKNLRRTLTYSWRDRNKKFRIGSQSVEGIQTLPKNIINALNGLRNRSFSRLWDAKDAITALHSVIVPITQDRPEWVTPDGRHVKQNMFEPLSQSNRTIISALESLFDTYVWNPNNIYSIPNDVERGIIIDLVEILLMLKSPLSYIQTFNMKQVYDYSVMMALDRSKNGVDPDRMTSCLRQRYLSNFTPKRSFGCISLGYCDEYELNIPTTVENLKFLTPEAALCHPILNRYNDIRDGSIHVETRPSREHFDRQDTADVPEVEVFLYTALRMIIEKFFEVISQTDPKSLDNKYNRVMIN